MLDLLYTKSLSLDMMKIWVHLHGLKVLKIDFMEKCKNNGALRYCGRPL